MFVEVAEVWVILLFCHVEAVWFFWNEPNTGIPLCAHSQAEVNSRRIFSGLDKSLKSLPSISAFCLYLRYFGDSSWADADNPLLVLLGASENEVVLPSPPLCSFRCEGTGRTHGQMFCWQVTPRRVLPPSINSCITLVPLLHVHNHLFFLMWVLQLQWWPVWCAGSCKIHEKPWKIGQKREVIKIWETSRLMYRGKQLQNRGTVSFAWSPAAHSIANFKTCTNWDFIESWQ